MQKTPEPVKPVAVTVFAGKPDPEKFSIFPEMYGGKGKGPETGDFRDREAIASWSIGLPKKLGV